MKVFSVYAERCTGSTYLQRLMLHNFHIQLKEVGGWKHGIGSHTFMGTDQENSALFIGLVRDPVAWINSFSKDLPHVPKENRPLDKFLHNEFYSVIHPEKDLRPIEADRNYQTGARFKDIFELRKVKQHYLLEVMPKVVKHYELLRYEDLLADYEKILSLYETKYGLKRKRANFENIAYWKHRVDIPYKKKPITLPNEIIKEIWAKVDLEQEERLGYNIQNEAIII